MPRGIPNVKTRSGYYICTEAFSVTLEDGDHWFKVGQRVREDHELFAGESGQNRMRRLFLPEEEYS